MARHGAGHRVDRWHFPLYTKQSVSYSCRGADEFHPEGETGELYDIIRDGEYAPWVEKWTVAMNSPEGRVEIRKGSVSFESGERKSGHLNGKVIQGKSYDRGCHPPCFACLAVAVAMVAKQANG